MTTSAGRARRRACVVLVAAGLVLPPGAARAQNAPQRSAALAGGSLARVAPDRAATKPKAKKPAAKPAARAASPTWARPHSSDALSTELGNALDSHTRGGRWGTIVVSLTRGDTLFERNADAMMQPASTMKMFTAAVSLDQFGPDFTFRTAALRDGQVGSDGVLTGNLYLRGVGDPSLTPRFWHDGEPMDVLAKQIAATGIKRIHGDIVGDATAFDDKLIPDGWKSTYLGAAYAARVSALSLNENLVWVVVRPNGKGAEVTLDPATTAIPVLNAVRVVGGRGGAIRAARRPDGSILVSGSIGAASVPRRYSLVVENPAQFTTGALRASLLKVGVLVEGATRLGPTPGTAVEVAAIASPPLGQIIGEMNRESINLYAELLFRSSAHSSLKQVGSAESALANLRDFLSAKVGAPPSMVNVADGSGLSTLDFVTPRAMVELLGYAHGTEWGPVFHASLPVDGESGTLRRRAKGTPARGNLHAKTGTTNTVAALGGYVTARNGEVLAFSFIYNGSDRWNAKAAMDQMGSALAEFMRQ